MNVCLIWPAITGRAKSKATVVQSVSRCLFTVRCTLCNVCCTSTNTFCCYYTLVNRFAKPLVFLYFDQHNKGLADSKINSASLCLPWPTNRHYQNSAKVKKIRGLYLRQYVRCPMPMWAWPSHSAQWKMLKAGTLPSFMPTMTNWICNFTGQRQGLSLCVVELNWAGAESCYFLSRKHT